MQEVFKILPKLLREEGVDAELSEPLILAAFRRVAGENLRGNAVPFRVFQNQLVVAVADETWKKQLERMSGQLLFKLNGALGKQAISFIEFRIDTQTVDAERDKLYRDEKTRFEQDRIALNNVPDKVREAAENIKDENLRQHFLLAAGSALARKKLRIKILEDTK